MPVKKHTRKPRLFLPALLLMSVVLLCSCGNTGRQAGSNDKQTAGSDSLIRLAEKSGDYDRLLALVDSLELQGHISETEACRLRATAYSAQKHLRTAEFYWKKALELSASDKDNQDTYLHSAAELSNLLVNKGDFEGALQAAMPAVARMEQTGQQRDIRYAILLESIGRCQLNLGRDSEAEATYQRVFDYYEEETETDTTGESLRHAAINAYNTALSYLRTQHYAEGRVWTERADSITTLYENAPGASADFAARVHALANLQRATSLQGMGRQREADRAYRAFAQTAYGQSDAGGIDATRYLVQAQRFAEAADKYQCLDRVLNEWGYDLSLTNMQRFLFPKFRANVGAGRMDSAVAVGVLMVDMLDSAIVAYRSNDATELAVIYDTQGKQMQIAQNRASLLRLRLIATLIVLALVVAFFVFYMMKRQKATRRLAAAHQQLAEANGRLEHSNQQLAEKNRQLEVANAKAEESSAMKTHFIQQISHEIRTPLNILSGFTQIVTMPGMELDEDTRRDINSKIMLNTERITGLVNKMLELSDANSQTVIGRNDTVEACLIAAQAAEGCGISEASHLSFTMTVTPAAEDLVLHTNQKAATRALSLLLDNALKFTKPAEALTVNRQTDREREHVTLIVDRDKDSGMALFAVEDTGKGVPLGQEEHIFDEFVQLDQYYDGTGIGLTVARSLARRLGGDVVLDTAYGTAAATANYGSVGTAVDSSSTTTAKARGARFVMTLPTE